MCSPAPCCRRTDSGPTAPGVDRHGELRPVHALPRRAELAGPDPLPPGARAAYVRAARQHLADADDHRRDARMPAAGAGQQRHWSHRQRQLGQRTAGHGRIVTRVLRGCQPDCGTAGRSGASMSLVRPGRPADGIVNLTDRPPSSRGWALAVPPWIEAIDATMARPRPKPSWEVRSVSRWNGSKIRPASTGLTTRPVLATVSWLVPAVVRVLTQMSPAAVLYRTALSTRFAISRSTSSGS